MNIFTCGMLLSIVGRILFSGNQIGTSGLASLLVVHCQKALSIKVWNKSLTTYFF